MRFKNKNVRLGVLVALPALLLSVSTVGCSTLKDESGLSLQPILPGFVSGVVRDDVGMDGYDAADPALSPDEALRKSMRLLKADGTVAQGPIDRTDEGLYVFMAPAGDYKVEASCPGYETKARLVTIPGNGSATKNFGLIKLNPQP